MLKISYEGRNSNRYVNSFCLYCFAIYNSIKAKALKEKYPSSNEGYFSLNKTK